MKSQTFHRTARGLFSQFNRIHGMPEGALLEAQNVDISREGVISKSRGRARYGAQAAGEVKQLLEFKDRMLRHVGSTLQYDTDGAGTWSASFSQALDPPDSMNKVRATEALLSLYMTSEYGILKKATLADEPVYAGIPEGLDLETNLTGAGDGMFLVDSAVSYRVVFGRKDANDKDLVGAPTWRETITNVENTGLAWTNSGTTVTVTHTAHGYSTNDIIEIADSGDANIPAASYTITKINDNSYSFTVGSAPSGPGTLSDGKKFNVAILAGIPPDINEGDFFRVYRTEFAATAATATGDEMKLVREEPVNSTHVSNGWVTYTDDRDEAFLGEPLYTNALEEGATAENGRPPWAADATLWKGHVWYFNCKQPPSVEFQLLTTSTLSTTAGDWIELTSEGTTRRYFSHSTENFSDPFQFAVWTAGPGEAVNVEKTMKSFCRVVNRDTTQNLWTAKYISGEDDSPGRVEIRKVRPNSGALTVICDQTTTGELFEPEIPISGTDLQTEDNWDRNGLYRSKFEQAEAVPIGSFDPIGSEYYKGLRALGLRDSLILLTQKGIFRVSGESDGSSGATFTISELDPSIHVVAPDAAAIVDNSVYCLSTQGVVRIDESATDLMSHPYEDELKTLFAISGYEALCFGVGYEQEHRYILYRPEKSTDTQATVADVWNYVTQTWTRRYRTMSSAHVLFNEEKLFEGDALGDYVLRERKTYGSDLSDFQDETIATTITSPTTTTNARGETVSQMTVTYSAADQLILEMQAGFVVDQGLYEGTVESVTQVTSTTFTVTLDTLGSFTAGAATLSLPIISRVRWRPEAAGNPGVETHFLEVAAYMEANLAKEHILGFASNVEESEQQLDPYRIHHLYGWGEMEWGDDGWGDESDPGSESVRVTVPYPFARCSALSVSYEHRRARETFDIASLAYTIRPVGEKNTQGPRS